MSPFSSPSNPRPSCGRASGHDGYRPGACLSHRSVLRSDVARNLSVERSQRQIYDDRWHFFAFLAAADAGVADVAQALIVVYAPRAYAVAAEVAAALQVRGAGLSVGKGPFCVGRDAVATASHAAVHTTVGAA